MGRKYQPLKANDDVLVQHPLGQSLYDKNNELSWWSGDQHYGLKDYNKTQGEIAYLMSSQEAAAVMEQDRLIELVNRLRLTSFETSDAMFLDFYALTLGPEAKEVAMRLQKTIGDHIE